MSGARRRFRFIKEIAEGGFGKVYLAEQLSQDGFSRIVALKLLHQKWSTHDEVVMRTRDEARLLGLIRHQHIVRVEDLTAIDGKLAIVMEYLEGVDLKGMMAHLRERGEHFPRQALFEIMIAVAGALDAAYNGEPLQGGEPLRVIHRDIKPSNIFVTVNGGIKVLDFGTARANFDAREAKTQALAFGSQGYMAPERMLGEEDTPAADVFSLGITLQELLSLEPFGRIPPRPNKFASKIEEKIAGTHIEGDPEWVDQMRETLHLMLAYEPAERPSGKQLIDIFELLAQGAGDMGIRRFCRVMVTEAKAAIPEQQTNDPLTGAIVEEDPSSVWGIVSGPLSTSATPEPFVSPTLPPQAPAPAPVPAPAPTPAPQQRAMATPAPAPAPSSRAEPAPQAVSLPEFDIGDEFEEGDAEPTKGRGGMIRIMLAVVAVVVILGLLLTGVVALAVAVTAMQYGYVDSPQAAAIAETPPTEPPPTVQNPAVQTPPAPPGLTLPEGYTVVSPDRRGADAPRSKSTSLAMVGDDSALVTLAGSGGYKAEWDGRGKHDAGALPAGRYRTFVTPASTKVKIRGATIEVVAGQSCDFVFDVAAKAWTGGCK
ncbi:MAG: serine/threonine-protein kinase [Myxococcota bacterium]